MGIPAGGLHTRMAKGCLHQADRRATIQRMARMGMSRHVQRAHHFLLRSLTTPITLRGRLNIGMTRQ